MPIWGACSGQDQSYSPRQNDGGVGGRDRIGLLLQHWSWGSTTTCLGAIELVSLSVGKLIPNFQNISILNF